MLPGFGRATTLSVQVIPADLEIEAWNHLQTNVPAPFTGMDVAAFLGANRFYSAGITGQNTLTANVEAGHIWGTASGHETLTHVTSYTTGTGALGDTDRHATWVGMIIGGRNGGANQGGWQTGIAPQTDLRSGAIATSWAGAPYALSFNISGASFLSAYNAYFGSANVINSSWGFVDATGDSGFTVAGDGFARQNPQTTLVLSAGNSGSGANTVGGMASGHNSITVAALGGANTFNSVASFSSRGPQDYADPVVGTVTGVRAAVDIAAPGESLVSAFYGGTTGGNTGGTLQSGTNLYAAPLAGTSFAAPIVAGAAALLNSASIGLALGSESRDARVVKAVLLNSADKTSGWSNGQGLVGSVVTTTQSLDWAVGAGRLNLDRTYDQYLSGTRDVAGTGGGGIGALGWDYGTLSAVGQANDYPMLVALMGGTPLTVTVDWFRNRSVNVGAGTALDIGFANLDLQVWDNTFSTLYGSSQSLYNDVEHLYLTVPATGLYGLRVAYTGQMFGTPVTEAYGLAWWGTAIPEPAGALLLLLAACLPLGRRPRHAR
jgi:subtilisin family serine protease